MGSVADVHLLGNGHGARRWLQHTWPKPDVVPSDGGLAAEKELVRLLSCGIKGVNESGREASLINLGAGPEAVIETRLADAGGAFFVDRVDVDMTLVSHPNVRRQWEESIACLMTVEDGVYDMAFANYVLEHVGSIDSAVSEIARILRPGGLAVVTVPNPRAPEFIVAAHTPQRFHERFRPHGFETRYAYRSIPHLRRCFERCGLRVERHLCHSVAGAYSRPLPTSARWIAARYDDAVLRLSLVPLCGAVALAARRADVADSSSRPRGGPSRNRTYSRS